MRRKSGPLQAITAWQEWHPLDASETQSEFGENKTMKTEKVKSAKAQPKGTTIRAGQKQGSGDTKPRPTSFPNK